MDFEQYTTLIAEVNAQLEQIAGLNAEQTILGCTSSNNPQFVALIKRHQQLLARSDKLSEEMLTQFNQHTQ